MSEIEHCSWCEQIIHDERHVCWSFEAVAKSDYDKLKQENQKLRELVRVGLDMVEQLKDQRCLPAEVDTFTEKANQLLGDKHE